MKLYAFKDVKAASFIEIFPAKNQYTALRSVSGIVNEAGEKTLFAKYPEDFQLFYLGEMDEDTGLITPKVEFIENFLALKKTEHEENHD